jgi:hypothetical protein
MSARSRRLRGSIGSSWGDAGYSSDDNDPSIHTASDPNSDADYDNSDQEIIQEYTDKATPLLSRSTRASLPQRHETPTNTPTRATARHSQNASSKGTPRSKNSIRSTADPTEPSLIMPRASVNGSLDNLMGDYASGTPTRNSHLRSRKQHESSSRNSFRESPRTSNPSSARTSHRRGQQNDPGPWHYFNLFSENVALPLLAYVWDVFSYANRHFFKPVLGLALGVGIIVFGLQMASGLVYSKLTTALAPVCLIPGSSYMFSMCADSEISNHADFEELVNVQGRFEDILDASKETSTLPATIKDSELAIRDLRTLVRHSRLPSRNQLDLEFHNFVLTANEASIDLSRYNSRIGAAMDRVIATNTWTMAVLQGIGEQDAAIGSVSRVFNAVTGAFVSPPPTLQQRIFDQYVLHVGKNKEEITRLIETAQALLQVLQNLDERLDTIYSITVNDDQTISKNQDELLSQLWTKLGGNSATVKANAKQLNLLKNISGYRKKALKHVSETLLKLQEIQAELENLREGVAAPEVLGWREGFPITYHMDMVEKGVDRLRVARGDSMRVEGETYRNRIRGSEGSEGLRELPAGKSTPIVTIKGK